MYNMQTSIRLGGGRVDERNYPRFKRSYVHHNRFQCKFLGFSLHLTKNEVIA